jgi:hypothetical protein
MAQFRLNHLYNIDAVTNTFSIDVFTRMHWKDPRLAFNVSTLYNVLEFCAGVGDRAEGSGAVLHACSPPRCRPPGARPSACLHTWCGFRTSSTTTASLRECQELGLCVCVCVCVCVWVGGWVGLCVCVCPDSNTNTATRALTRASKTFAEVLEIEADGSVFWGRQQLLTMAASLDLHEFPFE